MPTKKLERVKDSVDRNDLIYVLKKVGVPEPMFEMACNRIDKVICAIRHIETDIGITSYGKLLTKNAQDPIKAFLKTSNSLKDAAVSLRKMDAPRQRYKGDPNRELFYPERGADHLRKFLAHEIARIFSPEFLGPFGINLTEFVRVQTHEDRGQMRRGPLRERSPAIEIDTYELRQAIAQEVNPITAAVLDRIADALSGSARALEPERRRGGKETDPIKRFLLINLTQLWDDVFDSRKPIYVDEVYRDFFDFVKGICRVMGVPSYCTKHQLNQVIPAWKTRSPRQPHRKKLG
jgi:hypothetical protein